jgi:hypothetical protein
LRLISIQPIHGQKHSLFGFDVCNKYVHRTHKQAEILAILVRRVKAYSTYVHSGRNSCCSDYTHTHTHISGGFKMFPESIFSLRSTKQCNHLSYISFKLVPLRKYTFLPATVKVLERLLETILWKSFQVFR